jgi:hypothetical protein
MTGTSQTIRDEALEYFSQGASDLAKEVAFGSAYSKYIITSDNNLCRIKEWDIQGIRMINDMEDGVRKISMRPDIQQVQWKYHILVNVT